MSALTAPRDTRTLGVGDNKAILALLAVPQKGSTKCYSGGVAVIDTVNAPGLAQPGKTGLGLIALGFINVDNVVTGISDSTGLADSAITLRVMQGVGALNNSTAGDTIANVNIGQDCYLVDDQTVALTDGGGTRSAAGKVILVDPLDGVYVAIGMQLTTGEATHLLQLQIGQGNPEEIAANAALSTTKRTSRLTVSGTKAYTLANGVVPGQRKTIFCEAATSTPVGVVTPATASGFTTLTFSTANGSIELEWDTSVPGWKVVGVGGTVTIT